MLLSNNPLIDADELERKLHLLSEYRRRSEVEVAPPQPAVSFEQEASHAIVALALPVLEQLPEPLVALPEDGTDEIAAMPDDSEVPVLYAPEVPVPDVPEVPVPDVPEVPVPDVPEVPVPDAPEMPVPDAPEVNVPDVPEAPAPVRADTEVTTTLIFAAETSDLLVTPAPIFFAEAPEITVTTAPISISETPEVLITAATASSSTAAQAAPVPPALEDMPPPAQSAFRLPRKLTSIVNWFRNVLRLNSRLYVLQTDLRNTRVQLAELDKLRANIAELERLPARLVSLEQLPARMAALEQLPARMTALEQLPARMTALEKLPARMDALENLPARVDALENLPVRIDALEQLPARMTTLEKLPTRIDALEKLPARIDQLEHLAVRIDHLETLPIRVDELEMLPEQLMRVNSSVIALHEANLGVFKRLDTQDLTNHGVETRIGWLEALKIGARLSQLDQSNIANRLNRLDALDISNRLNAWDMTNVANRLHRLDGYQIGERLEQLDAMLKTVLDRNLERDNRIAALVKKFRSAPAAPSNANDVAAPSETSHADIDQFYVEFEGLFRGAPEAIRERLKVYLPYVEALAADPSALVVDVGCGRGEWLGLLHEHGVRALGIDMNAAMVELCRERGLEAHCTDAIAWLAAQPAGSVAMVTGFHLIEHLPFETLLALFDAALHALRPDGMLIFETPNPENLVVGACHFYYDPTHRNPIVPAVAEFMARQRGFARAEILRVNAYPDSYLLEEDSEVAIRINRAFYSAQDFAVLAWKTHAP